MTLPRTLAPLSLTALRLVLGPVMIWLSYRHYPRPWLLVSLLLVAILSDIFDGIVARRLKVAGPTLRRLDSQTDLVFWLCASWCVWVLHPDLIRSHAWPIITLLTLEATCYAVSFLRFGRETCTHAYSAKAWGLTIFAAYASALGLGVAGVPFWIMFVWGVVTQIEVIAIILALPAWRHDVPSIFHALRLRAAAAASNAAT